jgi:hypothetical protein
VPLSVPRVLNQEGIYQKTGELGRQGVLSTSSPCGNLQLTPCRWLYALFLAIDANFRLKRKLVSNNARDPGLSKGWAYFVEEYEYKEFLRERIDMPQEVSTPSILP